MANWCRTVLRVLGPELDIARFAACVAQDEEDGYEGGTLTQLAEICEIERGQGRAKFEVLTKWRPPLAPLVELSREYPTITFQVDWQQPGDELVGCAVIVDGAADIRELDDRVRDAKNRLREYYRLLHGDGCEGDDGIDIDDAEVELEYEILQESARRFFGEHPEGQGERRGERRSEVCELARIVVQEALFQESGQADRSQEFLDESHDTPKAEAHNLEEPDWRKVGF